MLQDQLLATTECYKTKRGSSGQDSQRGQRQDAAKPALDSAARGALLGYPCQALPR